MLPEIYTMQNKSQEMCRGGSWEFSLAGNLGSQSGSSEYTGGGGVKFFVSKYVALKAKYRYERYSREETETFISISSTFKQVVNFHNVLSGVSVFLPGGE